MENKRIMALFAGLLLPCLSYADIDGGTDPNAVLQAAFNYIDGTIGKSVAVLALAGTGFACFGLGKIPKMYFFAVLTGIAIIFGASNIMTDIGLSAN